MSNTDWMSALFRMEEVAPLSAYAKKQDYISREAALSAQNKSMNLSECRKRLERIPAADVRPVVRCKDCKHWKSYDNTGHHLCTYVAGAQFIRKSDDFCSRGAKMEENDAS